MWLGAGIIAGMLVQNTLKHLLEFGQVTRYLGYAALTDFFPQEAMMPNPECSNALCARLQTRYQVHFAFCPPPPLSPPPHGGLRPFFP